MREPWETLLGQFHDHWMLGEYLKGDAPLVTQMMDDDRWPSLSSGEQALVLVAKAMLTINEAYLFHVDEDNKARIATALRIWVDA